MNLSASDTGCDAKGIVVRQVLTLSEVYFCLTTRVVTPTGLLNELAVLLTYFVMNVPCAAEHASGAGRKPGERERSGERTFQKTPLEREL